MRPNIEISHTLNGRVKDFAAGSAEYETVEEAYRDIIKAGLAELEAAENAGEKEVATDTEGTPDADVPEPATDTPDAADAAIASWVPEGDVATSTARDATRTAVAWLRDHEGRATRSTIVDAAKPGEVSEQQWWVRGAQPGLAMLAEEGVVERPTSKSYQIDG